MSTEDRKVRGNDVGPTGRTVAKNVKRVRVDAGLTQKELSDRLAEAGRPIPVASIGKIESGDRRVEVDDLVAIAVALGVNPNALLFPRTTGPGITSEITAYKRANATPGAEHEESGVLWAWAVGAGTLDPESKWGDANVQWQEFTSLALPFWVGRVDIEMRTFEENERLRAMFDRLGRMTGGEDGEHSAEA